MIIYFYLLIMLKILTSESSSIRGGALKNDLVSLLSSRTDLGRKDTNSLKIISQEPFIIQLGVSNDLEKVKSKDDSQDRKRKRPAKRRFSKLKSLRKKHRIRRDAKVSNDKRIHGGEVRKLITDTDKLITDELAKNLLVNITSKQPAQDNSIIRQEMIQALAQAINATQQNTTNEDIDNQYYEWLKTQFDTKKKSHHHHPLTKSDSTPIVGMVHQLPRKTDKTQPKYMYKDLMADRERLEQKINSLKNMMSSNDSKLADDGTRVRRKSESDKVNKMAKMFLTLSAVNGIHDRKKFKCKEEEDDDGGDLWAEERKSSPLRRTSSTNEERYKVKKWIEHLKSKRSSRTCPCQNNGHEDEADIFPLELKLSKGLSSRSLGDNSEESDETYKGREYSKFLDYPHGKTSKNSWYKPHYSSNHEDSDNKLSVFPKRGRRKYDLPLDDLETYRSRAKQILQNAEEILDKIKDEEERRRAAPSCFANHLKELTSRIQGDPRNSENDLIRVLHKTLGWNPLTKAEEGTNEGNKEDEGSFLNNKWSILDPYEKAKALTEENTRQLSSYLLRNLGKIGQPDEQPAQEETKLNEPDTDDKTQIYHGQVPQDKDSALSFGDLRKENNFAPENDLKQPYQEADVNPTTIEPENKEDSLRNNNFQEPIEHKIKEILEEQGKQIEEFAGKHPEGEEINEKQPESMKAPGRPIYLTDYNDESDPAQENQYVENPKEADEEKPMDLENVEAVKSKEDENPSDLNQDEEVEAVKDKENSENDEKSTDPGNEDENSSKLLKAQNNNLMDADPEDSKAEESAQEEELQPKEAVEGDDKLSDLDDGDQVEAIKGTQNDDQDDKNLPEEKQDDQVEADQGEENNEENPTELTRDDNVEAVNSKENPEGEQVEATEGKDNDEGEENPTDITEDDKVQSVQGKENDEIEEKIPDPDEVEAEKPPSPLKKNFKNVDSDEKTEDYNSKEITQGSELKQEDEKERSDDGGTEMQQENSNEEPNDFINKETPKANSLEDNETQQNEDESDVMGSQNLTNSGDQENQTEPDVIEMSNLEDIEISKLTKEDQPTVAEPGPTSFEESSESIIEPKENKEDKYNEEEANEKETDEGTVAAENTEFNRESNEAEENGEEQAPEKDMTAREHWDDPQENKSEESNDPLTEKAANPDEETSDINDRDENDLLASKHLKNANEQLNDGVQSKEESNELKDTTKEHVSNPEEVTSGEKSMENESGSKENDKDDGQVARETPGKLESTENDKSESSENQANVPEENDLKTVGVPENNDEILEAEAQKTDDGLGEIIENILGQKERTPNEEKEDSNDEKIQSESNIDENPTAEDIVQEQPNQTDEQSGEIKPLLTWNNEEQEHADLKSDDKTKSSEHNPQETSRANTKDEDWSIETGAPQQALKSKSSDENMSEELNLGAPKMAGDTSESEENLDYENPNENYNEETLREANPIEDNHNPYHEDPMPHEENLQESHLEPMTNRMTKLSVPRSISDIIKDLNDGKIKHGDDMSSLDPEKIDYFIDKIDKAKQNEQAHENDQEVDCKKECACADEIESRSKKIGRYEIVKDILHWMKDLQLNRVLSDD